MLRCLQSVRREGSLDVTIGSDRFVWAVTSFPAFELIGVLRNQVALDPVASDKRQTLLEDFQLYRAPETRRSLPGACAYRLALDGHFRTSFCRPEVGRSC